MTKSPQANLLTHDPYAIRLSPSNILHIDCSGDPSPQLLTLIKTFNEDWRAGWFSLAAHKPAGDLGPSIRFWQDISSHFLSTLCHLTSETEDTFLDPPARDLLNEWILRAPPMIGAEYLTVVCLESLWVQLNMWMLDASAKEGGIRSFLAKWAPLWQQVGRVCFHLAENKKDPERPFAFLSTYSVGPGSNGKPKHLPLKEALNQYSGTKHHQTLVKLLTPVKTASEKCPWVQELVSTGEIYQPLALSASRAYKFLSSIPDLEESGLSIRIPNWWKSRPRPQVSVTIGSKEQPSLGVSSMLDFNVQIALGDEELSEEELSALLASRQNLVILRGQWVEVDREKLQEALDHWKKVRNNCKNGEISFIEGMRLLAGAPAGLDSAPATEQQHSWHRVSAGDALSQILHDIRNPSTLLSTHIEGLNANLRPYQQDGVSWLSLLSRLGLGACLADDMGLGKTIQVLSLLLKNRQHIRDSNTCPSLLIVPVSLLANWQREAERFCPSLKLTLLHPSETSRSTLAEMGGDPSNYFNSFDLVITTYSMAIKLEWLSKVSWNLLILDEAQAIKNPGTKQTKAIKRINSRSRIALTGTPIENRLSDLWSLFDFLNPGLLGTANRFQQYITSLQNSPGQFESLRKLTSPYILRRMKTDPKIISDLPEKIETRTLCQLTKQQAHHYQATINWLRRSLKDKETDQKARRGLVLNVLLQLKQICNHPSHFAGTGDYTPSHSGKFERLGEICEELASRQEKVLIFTQFSEIINPLEEYLSMVFGRRGLILHGGTPVKDRQALVETFQKEDGPPFFVLSLKAGGTGLTLTEASHVIHFDRWWNPAVENQATDRAFRIGQKKNVQVHKFIMQGTVEEHIDAIIESKRKLASDILMTTEEVRITDLPDDELLNLLSLDIDRT